MKNKSRKIFLPVILVLLTLAIIFSIVIVSSYDYIYGALLFRKIGRDITVNIKDDFDKATMVAYWVFKNIDTIERYPYAPTVNDNFLNVYKRGFGSCDQSAYVYAVMMRLLGFKSRVLFLIDEKGISPHTVAVVRVKGKDMIVSTTFHFIFADENKNPVGPDELEGSKVFEKYLEHVNSRNATYGIKVPLRYKPSFFKNGIYSETFLDMDYMKMLRRVISKIVQNINRIFPKKQTEG